MSATASDIRLRAVIVGDRGDDFVGYVGGVLDDFEVEYVLCEDVYSAMTRLAKMPAAVVVLGRFERLNREGTRFFEMLREQGHICCCYVDSEATFRRKGIFEAARAGAMVLQKRSQIEQVVSKTLAGGVVHRNI